jgi:hypothetical protein
LSGAALEEAALAILDKEETAGFGMAGKQGGHACILPNVPSLLMLCASICEDLEVHGKQRDVQGFYM